MLAHGDIPISKFRFFLSQKRMKEEVEASLKRWTRVGAIDEQTFFPSAITIVFRVNVFLELIHKYFFLNSLNYDRNQRQYI